MRSRALQSIGYSLLIAVGLACVGCTKGGGSGDVPTPRKLQSDRVLGYIALPGLEKVIQDVVSIVKQFAPEQANEEMLKLQVGMQLGDPELKNLDLTKPIVAVAFRPEQPGPMPTPPMAFYIPARSASPYTEILAQRGAQTKFSGGVLIAAQTAADLELAEKNLSFYNGLDGEIKGTGRLYLHMGRLLETFGPMIDEQMGGLMEQMKAGMSLATPEGGADQMATVLLAEIQGFLALAKECEEVQADIDLGPKLVQFEKVVVGKSGSKLGGFFSASAAKPAVSQTIVGSEGLFAGAFHCDSASLGALVKHLLAEMGKTPEVAKMLPATLTDLWTDLSWWSGDAAMAMAVSEGGVFTTDYAMGVADEDKYLALVETASKFFEPGAVLGDLYRGMGIDFSVELEKDVRKHGDVAVHRFKMNMKAGDEGSALATQAEMLKGLMRDYEIAFVNGQCVVSQDASRLDTFIEAAQAGTGKPLQLAAIQAFGSGRHGYMDYDILGLVKTMVGAIPLFGQATEVFDRITAKGALVFAVTFAENRVLVQGGIPLEPFVQLFNELQEGM